MDTQQHSNMVGIKISQCDSIREHLTKALTQRKTMKRLKQDSYDTPRGGWKLVISNTHEVAISAT